MWISQFLRFIRFVFIYFLLQLLYVHEADLFYYSETCFYGTNKTELHMELQILSLSEILFHA